MPTTTSNAAPAPTKPATPVTTVPVTPAASKAVSITIKNYAFLPKTITIKKGTTVTWTNSDIAKHTVTSDSGSGPSSSFFGMGESYSYTFTQTGSFPYHCEPHPYMTATIVVTE
jgi:plastocyanin